MKDQKDQKQPKEKTDVGRVGKVTIDPKTGRQHYTEEQSEIPKGFWKEHPRNPGANKTIPDPLGNKADVDEESAFDFINKGQGQGNKK